MCDSNWDGCGPCTHGYDSLDLSLINNLMYSELSGAGPMSVRRLKTDREVEADLVSRRLQVLKHQGDISYSFVNPGEKGDRGWSWSVTDQGKKKWVELTLRLHAKLSAVQALVGQCAA